MGELRRWNIIGVSYDTISKIHGAGRLAKSHKLLDLYDPVILKQEWQKLEGLYGKDKVTTARQYAEIVFKENAPEVVEDIIKNINLSGEETVKKASNIVSKKNIDNPKRCYAYVKGILKNLQ